MAFGLGSSRVIFTLVYLIVRSVPGLLAMQFRRDLSKDAELLVLRHENAAGFRAGQPRQLRAGNWSWSPGRPGPHRRPDRRRAAHQRPHRRLAPGPDPGQDRLPPRADLTRLALTAGLV